MTEIVHRRSSDETDAPRIGDLSGGHETRFRLLVVADVRLYREGMRDVLASRPQFSTVATAGDQDEAIRLISELQPDVVIVDMATRLSLDVVRTIRRADPHIRIVGFGVQEVEGEILACAEAGLAGYVPCEASLDDLVERTLRIMRGELLCTPRMAAAMFRRLELRKSAYEAGGIGGVLTAREREVLQLIDGGLSNKEIASSLNIEVSTVKNHVHNLLEKLHVTSRMQAAAQLGSHLTVRQRVLGLAGQSELD